MLETKHRKDKNILGKMQGREIGNPAAKVQNALRLEAPPGLPPTLFPAIAEVKSLLGPHRFFN